MLGIGLYDVGGIRWRAAHYISRNCRGDIPGLQKVEKVILRGQSLKNEAAVAAGNRLAAFPVLLPVPVRESRLRRIAIEINGDARNGLLRHRIKNRTIQLPGEILRK